VTQRTMFITVHRLQIDSCIRDILLHQPRRVGWRRLDGWVRACVCRFNVWKFYNGRASRQPAALLTPRTFNQLPEPCSRSPLPEIERLPPQQVPR
jgi:hypothetical protein